MSHDFKAFPELTNSQMDFYYFDSPHKQITEDFVAEVVKVIDGDTIRVIWDQRNFSFLIRFLDIDAAEIDTIDGVKSRNWLESMILGETVDIMVDPNQRVDKWGRLLGRVLLEGVDMAEMSLGNGFSVPFERRIENEFA